MKVLIVGGGGREHAIAWKVAESPLVDKVYCAPGNAGIEEVAECVPIGAMEFDKLVAFAKEKAIDLTVIGIARCTVNFIYKRTFCDLPCDGMLSSTAAND